MALMGINRMHKAAVETLLDLGPPVVAILGKKHAAALAGEVAFNKPKRQACLCLGCRFILHFVKTGPPR